MELQDLRKESDHKVEEYKDAYRDFKKGILLIITYSRRVKQNRRG